MVIAVLSNQLVRQPDPTVQPTPETFEETSNQSFNLYQMLLLPTYQSYLHHQMPLKTSSPTSVLHRRALGMLMMMKKRMMSGQRLVMTNPPNLNISIRIKDLTC